MKIKQYGFLRRKELGVLVPGYYFYADNCN